MNLPHTWNSIDGTDGKNDYYRGTCYYARYLNRPTLHSGEQLWLEITGAAMTASVCVNGEKLCTHEGGYSTFRVNLTDALTKEENQLSISVDNSKNDRVYPQKADFTFYGGLYRQVKLITVPAAHFALGVSAALITVIVAPAALTALEASAAAAETGSELLPFFGEATRKSL